MPLYYFEDTPRVEGPEDRNGIVFVAGFAHPPNVDAAKWLVQVIMPVVRARWGGRPHLWLVGSNPAPEIEQLAGDDVTVTGYVSDERLLEFYRSARVAIVPLRVGAGMKGKVIEALHYGIPLVTTPVGAQGLNGLESVVPVSSDENAVGRGDLRVAARRRELAKGLPQPDGLHGGTLLHGSHGAGPAARNGQAGCARMRVAFVSSHPAFPARRGQIAAGSSGLHPA
jgi:glycosyltransferase involved in cell wall biosynthesis